MGTSPVAGDIGGGQFWLTGSGGGLGHRPGMGVTQPRLLPRCYRDPSKQPSPAAAGTGGTTVPTPKVLAGTITPKRPCSGKTAG